jgi:hypothetical protein
MVEKVKDSIIAPRIRIKSIFVFIDKFYYYLGWTSTTLPPAPSASVFGATSSSVQELTAKELINAINVM